MHDLGLKATLNTDDPAVSNITLSDECHIVAASMGFELSDLKKMTITALESAFLPPAEKEQLIAEFKQEMGL
jgi:adenosine deaminase